MIRAFIVGLILAVLPVWGAEYVVPTNRLPFAGSWTPNAANGSGVPGGVPTRTNLINVTQSPYTADPTGVVDCTATVQTAIDAGADGDVIYFPNGTYKVSGTLTIANPATHNTHHITLRGQSQSGVTLVSGASPAIQLGSPSTFGIPSGASVADMTVSAGLTAGSSSITIGDTSRIPNGTLIRITPVNDTSIPTLNVDAAPSTVGQIVRVGTKSGSTVLPISPKLFDDYGGGSLLTTISTAPFQGVLVGVESMTIDLRVGGGSTGVAFDNCWSCWVKDVKVFGASNYQVNMQFTCQCEVRHSYIDSLGLPGSNHAGILHDYGCSDLIEDNVIIASKPDIELNSGSAGVVFSRNYGNGSEMNSNHGATNRFDVFEGNWAGGILDDGYFGGTYKMTYYNNVWGYQSVKRFARSPTFVGNFSLQADTDFQLGYPNIGNDSFSGTADYPGTPWADYGMTGTITAVTKGTGTGYVTSGTTSPGATQATLITGSGTILVGDVINFSGSQFNYYVTAALTGGVVHFVYNGGAGLQTSVPNGTGVTVSSDTGQLTYSGGSLSGDGGSGSQTPNLWWSSYGFQAKYRVLSNSGLVAQLGSYVAHEANAQSLPSIGTAVVVGAGIAGFQEKDLGVGNSILKAGNRYSNNVFDSLSGATSIPVSLIYTVSPQWLIDERATYSQAFPLQPFDPVTPVSPSASNIPAGYRYLFTVPPVQISASINTAGTETSVTFNKPLTVGVGGNAGMILSGGTVTLTFNRMSGSSAIYMNSRTIGDEETFTCSYTQPGNGLEDSNGLDLGSFSGLSVTNNSQQSQGSIWIQRVLLGQTDSAVSANQNSAYLQAVDIPAAGNITKIRIGIGAVNLFHQPCKAVLLDSSGVVLRQVSGNLIAQNDYQVLTISTYHAPAAALYYVALLVQSNGDPDLAIQSNTGSNSSFFSFNNVGYSNWPPNPVVIDGANTSTFSMGVRFTPDAQPSTLIINGTLRVGSGATIKLP